MVLGQVLGELVSPVLVLGRHPPHHACPLELTQVPVHGALGKLPRPEDLRDRHGVARADEELHQLAPPPRVALPDLGQSGPDGVVQVRRGHPRHHAGSPRPAASPCDARPLVATATRAKVAALIRTIVPLGARSHTREAARPPTTEPIPTPVDHSSVPRKDLARSWPLATGSTIIAAIRRIPTILMAATTAPAVRTARSPLSIATGSPATLDQSSSVT